MKVSKDNALLGCSGARMVRLPWNTVTHGSYPYVETAVWNTDGFAPGSICRIGAMILTTGTAVVVAGAI